VTSTVFRTFICRRFEIGRSYLVSDWSVECAHGAANLGCPAAADHEWYKRYAAGAAALYSLGIPVLYFALLRSRRHLLNPPRKTGSDVIDVYARNKREEVQHMRFLFESYKPQFWWFELFFMASKLVLSGVAVFILPGTSAQVLLAALTSLLSIHVLLQYKPFVDAGDNSTAVTAKWCVGPVHPPSPVCRRRAC